MINAGYKYYTKNEEVLEWNVKSYPYSSKSSSQNRWRNQIVKINFKQNYAKGLHIYQCKIQYHQAFTVTCLKLKKDFVNVMPRSLMKVNSVSGAYGSQWEPVISVNKQNWIILGTRNSHVYLTWPLHYKIFFMGWKIIRCHTLSAITSYFHHG